MGVHSRYTEQTKPCRLRALNLLAPWVVCSQSMGQVILHVLGSGPKAPDCSHVAGSDPGARTAPTCWDWTCGIKIRSRAALRAQSSMQGHSPVHGSPQGSIGNPAGWMIRHQMLNLACRPELSTCYSQAALEWQVTPEVTQAGLT